MMIKNLHHLLRAYWKERATVHYKQQKSKLLIYDEYLNKFVSADELLIPGEKKTDIGKAASLKKSKEFLLFDLLLKKFVNPKLDILTPSLTNVDPLPNIYDLRGKNKAFSTSSTDFFWGKIKKSKSRIPALPPVHNTTPNKNEPSTTRVGWAGQLTRKPVTDPRPEYGNDSGFQGPKKDPDKKKPSKKKKQKEKFTVCGSKKKHDTEEEYKSVQGGESKNNSIFSKTKTFEPDNCYGIPPKNEETHNLEFQKSDEGNINDCKENRFKSPPNCENKKEENIKSEYFDSSSSNEQTKNIFKKLCSQLFENKKIEKKCHKIMHFQDSQFINKNAISKGNDSKTITCNKDLEHKSKSQNNILVACNPAAKTSREPCEPKCNDTKPILQNDNHKPCNAISNSNTKSIKYNNKFYEDPKTKSFERNISKNNHAVSSENILCKLTIKENITAKSRDTLKQKHIFENKNNARQSKPCSKLNKNQFCDKNKTRNSETSVLNMEKTNENSKERVKIDCKKNFAQHERPSSLETEPKCNYDTQCMSKKNLKDQSEIKKNSPRNTNFNFMVRPKLFNLPQPCVEKIEREQINDCNNGKGKKQIYEVTTQISNYCGPKRQESDSNTTTTCIFESRPKGENLPKSRCLSENNTYQNSKVPAKYTPCLPESNKKQKKINKQESNKELSMNLFKSKSEVLKTKLSQDTTQCNNKSKNSLERFNDTNSSLKLHCQHIEPKVTEKLHIIARGKSLDEGDLNKQKSKTYMGFKIKKSCSKKSEINKCCHSVSKSESKKIIFCENKSEELKESSKQNKDNLKKYKNTMYKTSKESLKKKKSKKCLNNYVKNKRDTQEICIKSTDAHPDNSKTHTPVNKDIQDSKPSECCSSMKLTEPKCHLPPQIPNQKSLRKKSSKSKLDSTKPSKIKLITMNTEKNNNSKLNDLENVKVESKKGSCCTFVKVDNLCENQTDGFIKETSKNLSHINEDDLSSTNNSTEAGKCLPIDSLESPNMKEHMCKELSNNKNDNEDAGFISKDNELKQKEEKIPCLHEIESENHINISNVEMQGEKSQLIKDTSIGLDHCSERNEELRNKKSGTTIVNGGEKKDKHSKPKKEKLKMKSSEGDSLKNTKSNQSYTAKSWKRKALKHVRKTKSAVICSRNKTNKEIKKKISKPKAQVNKSNVSTKTPINITKSAPNLSNKPSSKKPLQKNNTNIHKQSRPGKLVKNTVICSKSSVGKSVSSNIAGASKNQKKTSLKKSSSHKKLPKSTLTKISGTQKILKESKSAKVCSLQTLHKRVTENPIKVSKRVEIKSFSELKSVSNPEIRLPSNSKKDFSNIALDKINNNLKSFNELPMSKEQINIWLKNKNTSKSFNKTYCNIKESYLKPTVPETLDIYINSNIFRAEDIFLSEDKSPSSKRLPSVKHEKLQLPKNIPKEKKMHKENVEVEPKIKTIYTHSFLGNENQLKLCKGNNKDKIISNINQLRVTEPNKLRQSIYDKSGIELNKEPSSECINKKKNQSKSKNFTNASITQTITNKERQTIFIEPKDENNKQPIGECKRKKNEGKNIPNVFNTELKAVLNHSIKQECHTNQESEVIKGLINERDKSEKLSFNKQKHDITNKSENVKDIISKGKNDKREEGKYFEDIKSFNSYTGEKSNLNNNHQIFTQNNTDTKLKGNLLQKPLAISKRTNKNTIDNHLIEIGKKSIFSINQDSVLLHKNTANKVPLHSQDVRIKKSNCSQNDSKGIPIFNPILPTKFKEKPKTSNAEVKMKDGKEKPTIMSLNGLDSKKAGCINKVHRINDELNLRKKINNNKNYNELQTLKNRSKLNVVLPSSVEANAFKKIIDSETYLNLDDKRPLTEPIQIYKSKAFSKKTLSIDPTIKKVKKKLETQDIGENMNKLCTLVHFSDKQSVRHKNNINFSKTQPNRNVYTPITYASTKRVEETPKNKNYRKPLIQSDSKTDFSTINNIGGTFTKVLIKRDVCQMKDSNKTNNTMAYMNLQEKERKGNITVRREQNIKVVNNGKSGDKKIFLKRYNTVKNPKSTSLKLLEQTLVNETNKNDCTPIDLEKNEKKQLSIKHTEETFNLNNDSTKLNLLTANEQVNKSVNFGKPNKIIEKYEDLNLKTDQISNDLINSIRSKKVATNILKNKKHMNHLKFTRNVGQNKKLSQETNKTNLTEANIQNEMLNVSNKVTKVLTDKNVENVTTKSECYEILSTKDQIKLENAKKNSALDKRLKKIVARDPLLKRSKFKKSVILNGVKSAMKKSNITEKPMLKNKSDTTVKTSEGFRQNIDRSIINVKHKIKTTDFGKLLHKTRNGNVAHNNEQHSSKNEDGERFSQNNLLNKKNEQFTGMKLQRNKGKKSSLDTINSIMKKTKKRKNVASFLKSRRKASKTDSAVSFNNPVIVDNSTLKENHGKSAKLSTESSIKKPMENIIQSHPRSCKINKKKTANVIPSFNKDV